MQSATQRKAAPYRSIGPLNMKSVILIAAAACVSHASAQTIVQTHSIPIFTASGSYDVEFDKFDTLGGSRILTGVTVSFSFDKSGGSYAIDNDSAVSGTVTFLHEIKANLYSSDVSLGSAEDYLSALSRFTTGVLANDGDPDKEFNVGEPGGDYFLYEPTGVLTKSHTATIGSEQWARYTGLDTFGVTFDAIQTFGVTGVGGLQSLTISSQVEGFVTVTYSYTDVVPEPQTALLGSVGVLLLLKRRRRN